ncbi:MAG: nucleotidyltransferase family protein [Solobacterium sp.]|jgi:predicted nucleotidyltransferase|nr:nucleotidyltransferase family protein [Solobacterium sp.]MCH4048140.1 nucleotidyltransferase family protein [Solobacterium sp.]MCH4075006.1 nucleotidyltransferase family protein [Solobacterium sp.]MCI1314236.1 nucleotidyltransferase family protein [Solobacterium sp.]MCI1346506.1 nucleotidyltransferase family protein [Solobacterium sp.]
MRVCGIVAEYNPFHTGHIHQICETKKQCDADVYIAVMSGNFVQRGEPAVIDKWHRAITACRHGIDAVIELPYVYAVQGASGFAHGAVAFLKNAGIQYLSFGSECGNLENLKEIADTPINPDHIKERLSAGMSYPKAYSLLTGSMMPNDILATAYLREIKDTSITPILIQRTGDYLDDTLQQMPSALAIRKALKENRGFKDATPLAEELSSYDIPWMEKYYPYLRTLLLTSSKEHLETMFLINEGIENHLVKHAAECSDWNSFLSACTTGRYTASRIRRSVLHIMNQVTKEEVRGLSEPDFFRVLAFNDTGRKWLHACRKNENMHICSKFSTVPYLWRRMEYRTTLLYASVMKEAQRQEVLQKEIEGAVYVR